MSRNAADQLFTLGAILGTAALMLWALKKLSEGTPPIGRIGAADNRRLGQPRTDEERMARHLSLYGTKDLPPRGTGLL